MNKKAFGQGIKEIRESKNITQDELAEKLCVTQQTVSSWERGGSYPDIEMVERICSVLEIQEQDIFEKGRTIEARESKGIGIGKVVGIIASVVVIGLIIALVALNAGKKNRKVAISTSPDAEKNQTITAEATPSEEPTPTEDAQASSTGLHIYDLNVYDGFPDMHVPDLQGAYKNMYEREIDELEPHDKTFNVLGSERTLAYNLTSVCPTSAYFQVDYYSPKNEPSPDSSLPISELATYHNSDYILYFTMLTGPDGERIDTDQFEGSYTDEECIKVADDKLKDIIDVKGDGWTLTDNEYGQKTYAYAKKYYLGHLKTRESYFVYMGTNGTILSFDHYGDELYSLFPEETKNRIIEVYSEENIKKAFKEQLGIDNVSIDIFTTLADGTRGCACVVDGETNAKSYFVTETSKIKH